MNAATPLRQTLARLTRYAATLLLLTAVLHPAYAQDDPPPPPPEDGGYQLIERAHVRGLALLALLPEIKLNTNTEPPPATAAIGEDDPPPPPPEDGGYQSVDRITRLGADLAGATVPQETAALLGNYPNPFNARTSIRFNLKQTQPVRLAIYNVLGQQVQLLVDGTLEAGLHEVGFQASDLPSGLYLTRLITPTGTQVRSMLLTR